MKKITKLIAAFAITVFGYNNVNAQAGDYALTASSGTFTSIVGTGETNQPLMEADSYLTPSTAIGFTFNFEGVAYTNFKASSNGFLSFGTSTSSQTGNNLDAVANASRPLVAPLWDDHDGNAIGGSSANYVVTGTAPNRVFTYEWLNWEWRYNSNDPVISFQVKLYETTNVIEFIYRPETGAVSLGSASIGITGLSSFLSLDGTGASPTASNSAETANLNTKPASGQVYTFSPPSCLSPSTLTANVTTTSANLGWTSTASSWDVEWSTAGFTQGAGTMITGTATNPHNLTSLTANTAYEFYVRADCGASVTSAWVGPFSFTTLPTAVTVPYNQDFEGGSLTDFSTSSAAQATVSLDAGSNCAGNNSLFFTGGPTAGWTGASTSATAIQAWTVNTSHHAQSNLLVDASAVTNSLILTFDLKQEYSYGLNYSWFRVLVNGVQVSTDYNPTTKNLDPCASQTVDLTAYIGTTFTLTFQSSMKYNSASGSSGQGDNAYLDNISITEISCLAPAALTATNITATAADLGWTSTAATFDIEWDIAGFSQGSGTMVTGSTTNPHNLTGLTGNTSYEYYVRADCGAVDGVSTWAGPFSFTTLCSAFATPFAENFSSTSTTQDCWTVLNENGDADSWNMDYSSNPLIGDEVAILYTDNNSGANDDYLISPALTVTGVEQLQFSYRAQTSNEPNHFQVLVSTTGNDPVNFTDTILVIDTVSNTSYQDTTLDLSAYTGDIYIAFHVPNGGFDGWRLYIDDVRVAEECVMPTAGIATGITSSSALIQWATSGTAAQSWSIEYGPTGFTQGTGSVINGTSFNPHLLSSLVDGADYDFYIISNCALEERSEWAGPFNFTTFITGVNENLEENNVSIFPNPNNGIFTLNTDANNATVKVMNTSGQVVLSKNIVSNNEQINLSNNAKGIYFVTVTSENGVSTHKVSVQ